MIGNHDVTRFASEVAGDAGGDPWDAAPAQPSDDDVYARQRLALGLVLALPGVPVVYYGDEVGLAGAADPDNRRVMPSSTALSDAQVGLLADAQRIAQTRRCLPALRRGARQTLVVTDDTWAFLRDTGDGAPALVVASRAATPIDVRVPPSAALSSGVYADIVVGDTLQVGAGPSVVALPAAGLRVFVPASHPCLVP
jgi:glycosidase